MSKVPAEVQTMHLRLFERYVDVLIKRLEPYAPDGAKRELDVARIDFYCERIERLLAIDQRSRATDFVQLSITDFEVLDRIASLVREITGPDSEEPTADEPEPPARPPEAENILQNLSPDDERGAEREPEAGLADNADVVLPAVQSGGDIRSDKGREKHQGHCSFCGHGSNSKYHREQCAKLRQVTDADRQQAADAFENLLTPAIEEEVMPSPEEIQERSAWLRERCARCNGAMRMDADPIDPGMYCITCGFRPRHLPANIDLPNEDGELQGKRRRRQPSHGGARL